MKSIGIMIALLLSAQSFAQVALGDIIGEVKDLKSGDPVYGAHVFTESNGAKYQAYTDVDGRFRLSGVLAGTHMVNIRQGVDTMKNLTAVVPMDGYANLGIIQFTSAVLEIQSMDVVANDGRMKLVHGSLPIQEVTSEDLEHSPARFDIKGMITGANSEVKLTDDGELVFRGARKGDMIYVLDGVKSNEISRVPGVAIARMQIYTGGLPAKYGDTLGGAIIVETKSYFDLYNAWRSEQIKSGAN
jgi:hypothetical protein